MASPYISTALREQIRAADRGICLYCRTSERNSGIPSAHDHIIPQSKGGETIFENLCHSCRPCNEFKGDMMHAPDPLSGDVVALFNPREQEWQAHFDWSLDDTMLIGKTAVGRATVVALRMNNQTIVSARRRWVIAGWHPPESSL